MQAFKSNIIEANEVTILLHGGVGRIHKKAISPETEQQYQEAIIHALTEGQKIISCGGKSIDAVEKVISILEDCPLFNAGKGAVYANNEMIELDAAIMDGKTLNAGAVAGVESDESPDV